MTTSVTLSATSRGNGFQATVTLPNGVSMSSVETYPSIPEAITAAAPKLLDLPERSDAFGATTRPEEGA